MVINNIYFFFKTYIIFFICLEIFLFLNRLNKISIFFWFEPKDWFLILGFCFSWFIFSLSVSYYLSIVKNTSLDKLIWNKLNELLENLDN